MKKAILISSIICFLTSCTTEVKLNKEALNVCAEKSGIRICQDTLHLDVPGFIRFAALYKENYYLFLRDTSDRDKMGNLNPIKLYQVSKDGKKSKLIPCPKEIESSSYPKLIIRNDSLVFYNQWENTFTLNTKNLSWTKSKYEPPVIYEDSDFEVSQICMGEFGGLVSFKNKHNGIIHDSRACCAITVNKHNSKYLVTTNTNWPDFSTISEMPCPDSLVERNKGSKNYLIDYIMELDRIPKTIFESDDVQIHTSFIRNDEIFHIYTNDTACFIGRLENGKLTEEIKLDFYPRLQHKLSNNDQFLSFFSKRSFYFAEEFEFGLIEIIKGELNIHYISN